MEKIRNFEDVMNALNKSEKYYRRRIEAWQGVKRLSKKDGSDFVALSKNFEGAKICMPYVSNSVYDKSIEVVFIDENGRYTTDYFRVWKKATSGQDLAGRNTYTQYGEIWYELTVNEIFEEINATIEKYQKWLDSIIAQKNVAQDLFNKIQPLVIEAKKIVDDAKIGDSTSTLHYALKDYVENFYWAR